MLEWNIYDFPKLIHDSTLIQNIDIVGSPTITLEKSGGDVTWGLILFYILNKTKKTHLIKKYRIDYIVYF